MSVSQVKKRFEDMEGYLCRDKEGLRRLKLLKDDVNVLRTSLAAAVDAKETAEAIKDAARERADRAEAELKEVELELQRVTAENESLRFQLQHASSQTQNETESADTANELTESRLKTVLKQLRKHQRSLPKCKNRSTVYRFEKPVWTFSRNDLASGWSHAQLFLLGAAVAVLVRFDGSIVIKDESGWKDMKVDKTRSEDECAARHLLQWLVNNIKDVPESKAGIARLDNVKSFGELSEMMEEKGLRYGE